MVKVFAFPTLRVETQLFHVPGAAFDGGLTAGGAQLITPEPGGLAVLEMQLAISDTEWQTPLSSWLMSKINGQVFRVRLAPSPQVAYSKKRGMEAVLWDNVEPWNNNEPWDGDFTAKFADDALQGQTTVKIDLTGVGPIVLPGHVFGHDFNCYLVDEITYDGDVATATITPPLRRDVAEDDDCFLRPWFTGRIANGGDIRSAYNNMGHVRMGKIIFNEAVV